MLEELQSLDEKQKMRVLIIATIIIMIIIVGIWVLYFNSIVIGGAVQPVTATSTATAAAVPAAPAAATTTTVTASTTASGPSLWQDIKNIFGSIANIFRSPSQYNIKPN